MEQQPIRNRSTTTEVTKPFAPMAEIRRQFPELATETLWMTDELFAGFEQFSWKFRHSLGVTENVGVIARAMKIAPGNIKRLQVAALVHDIVFGTFSKEIVDKKTEDLTDADRARIRTHVDKQLLRRSLQTMPEEYTDLIDIIALHHAYQPRRYAGINTADVSEDTLTLVRILAMADQYDALTHKRPYQQQGDVEEEIVVRVPKEEVRFDFMQPERFGRYPNEVVIAVEALCAKVAV